MPEIAADLITACSGLFLRAGIEESQSLGPDVFLPRACVRAREAALAVAADTPDAGAGLGVRCISAVPETGIGQSQQLVPDPCRARPRACEDQVTDAAAVGLVRDAGGRFAKGHSGNPAGRPRGIPNPRRRPVGLLLRQAKPGTLVPLIERRPSLRLPVLLALMGPPARRPDPGDLRRIDFSRLCSAKEIAAAIGKVIAAMERGEITPGEADRLTRGSRKPLRAIRRQLWREIAARKEALRRERRAATGKFGARASRPPDAAETAAVRSGKFPVKRAKIPCSQGISQRATDAAGTAAVR